MYIDQAKEIIIRYYKRQLKRMIMKKFPKKDTHFLKVKCRHSFECYGIVKEIIEKDPILSKKNDYFKQRLEVACLLHDIGRFFELTDELQGKPHGDFGADLLGIEENFRDRIILIAIRHHDKAELILDDDSDYISLSPEDREMAKEVSLALRDADKISNLYLFKRENTVYTRKPKKFGFSPEYFEAIQNGHLIDKSYKNTIFDSIAYYIIWYHELIFQGSKDFVLHHQLVEHLVKMYNYFINYVATIEEDNMTEDEIRKHKEEMRQNLSKIKTILKGQGLIS